MSSTIIINSTHFETSSGNRFVYRFPTNMKFAKGQSVALQSISLNNTFYNVEASRNNNQVSIIWNADTTVRHDFIIPDGFYTISLLNQYLQKQCKTKNLYFTNTEGDVNYLINIQVSQTSYICIVECLPLPSVESAAKEGFEKPAGATWNFPDEDRTVQIVVPTSGFGQLIGFNENTYPEAVGKDKVKIISNFTPHPTLINSLVLTCNLISSKYYNPINIFCSIPICAKFGSLINIINPSPIFNIITEGYYNNIVIEFLDQSFNRVTLHDSDVVLTLSIKEAE